MIIDKLYSSVQKKGVVCVGLDTSPSYLPEHLISKCGDLCEALYTFNKYIIDATKDIAACYKIQIAYYEALGVKGLSVYSRTLKYIREQGEIAIADIKRGDIKETASMYAKAHFTEDFESDFITLSPYMGFDSLEPYSDYFANKEKGCFVLVRTSNPGAKDIQDLCDRNGMKVSDAVAKKLMDCGEAVKGTCGYSSIGAVMGATNIVDISRLRNELDSVFFLVPGYGAQGAKASDAALFLKDGNGAIVNSSRAILLNYKKYDDGEKKFDYYAREEAISMNNAILEVKDERSV